MASRIATFGTGGKDYVRRHWRGRQSLALSFWVNLVLLRSAILATEIFAIAPRIEGSASVAIAALVFFIVADVMVYVWQVGGVIRACDAYQASYGAITVVWAAHFGILVTLIFTATSAFISLQNSFIERQEFLSSFLWERERAAKYALTLSDNGATLALNGSFEGGITKRFSAFLRAHPTVNGIVLASPGGNTYEGRGIARIILDRGLDTYVFADCFSACTLAFIAGAARILGPNGRLGFHQYGLDADYPVPFVDIAGEQDVDREFFKARKIEDAFLARIFDASQSGLWIPTTSELLAAGVVHKLATTGN